MIRESSSTPRPFDHAVIDEEGVVERYVTGRLTPEMAARFEEHYLGCVECVARVEDAERLQRGLGRLASEEVARVAAAGMFTTGVFTQWLGHPAVRAFAAAVFLAIFLGPWFVQSLRVDDPDGRIVTVPAPPDATRLVELSPLRSAPGSSAPGSSAPGSSAPGSSAPAQVLTLDPESPEWIVFALDVPSAPGGRALRVDLADADREVLWRSAPGEVDARGRFVLSLPSSDLPEGAIELRVVVGPDSPDSSERTIARFPLTVRRD